MNFRTANKRKREIEITVIPLIDLFMTVLVFFIVTTTFNRDTVFFVDLPQAKEAQGLGKDIKQLQVSLSEQGDISLNNQRVTISAMKQYLDELSKQGKKDLPVLIRADQRVTHGKVVDIIDLVQGAGFSNIGIATRQKQ